MFVYNEQHSEPVAAHCWIVWTSLHYTSVEINYETSFALLTIIFCGSMLCVTMCSLVTFYLITHSRDSTMYGHELKNSNTGRKYL